MSRKARTSEERAVGDAFLARVREQALEFLRLGSRWAASSHRSSQIRSLALYPPSTSRNGMWLCIAKAWVDGQKLVAFHRATDPLSAIVGLLARAEQQKLDWREDAYAQEG